MARTGAQAMQLAAHLRGGRFGRKAYKKGNRYVIKRILKVSPWVGWETLSARIKAKMILLSISPEDMEHELANCVAHHYATTCLEWVPPRFAMAQ